MWERKRLRLPCGDLGPKSSSRSKVLWEAVAGSSKREVWVGSASPWACLPTDAVPSLKGAVLSPAPALWAERFLTAITELGLSQIRGAPSAKSSCAVCISGTAPYRAARRRRSSPFLPVARLPCRPLPLTCAALGSTHSRVPRQRVPDSGTHLCTEAS